MKKITLFFVFLMMSAVAFNAAAASSLRGDVNGNGAVDISDVTALIGYVLTGNGSSLNLANADCTLNGEIDISDVTCLIDYVLCGTWPGDAHEWVDLGLPSGTLWATCNVGANSPEEYGDYFAWGETEPKDVYTFDNYKWGYWDESMSNRWFTKYETVFCDQTAGFFDGKSELDPEDDAAYINWGPSWRIPTLEQLQELIQYCNVRMDYLNDIDGEFVTGPNGNTLFLPTAGYRYTSLTGAKSSGHYWSRMLDPSYEWDPYYLHFYWWGENHFFVDGAYYYDHRERGCPVRAVRAQ